MQLNRQEARFEVKFVVSRFLRVSAFQFRLTLVCAARAPDSLQDVLSPQSRAEREAASIDLARGGLFLKFLYESAGNTHARFTIYIYLKIFITH